MLNLYKKTLAILAALLALTFVCGYLCVDYTFLHSELTPPEKSLWAWKTELDSDAAQGGESAITVNDDHFSLDFDINITDNVTYPFASLALSFVDKNKQQHFADLSKYSSLVFSAKCTPANVLAFSIFTFDEHTTTPNDPSSYRISTTFFSCSDHWEKVEIDLTRLETPQWWFNKFNLELSHQEYRLDKATQIIFGSSFQSPREIDANIQIEELNLHGSDWHVMYIFCGLLALLWGGFGFWFFRQHTKYLVKELKEKLQKDRPLVAYQQLSIEPQKDKEKSAILRFMATEYADPEISLEATVTQLGINRNKINDILKEELGYTFSTYLNKLRLTEAARLLSAQSDVNVAEIAYLVGYKNVPYFNKLFKIEYGCTPKVFKNTYQK